MKIQINTIRDDKRDITTHTEAIKKIINNIFINLYSTLMKSKRNELIYSCTSYQNKMI